MKGLLRKDIYMLAKYNRLFLIAVFVMAVAAAVTGSSFCPTPEILSPADCSVSPRTPIFSKAV